MREREHVAGVLLYIGTAKQKFIAKARKVTRCNITSAQYIKTP